MASAADELFYGGAAGGGKTDLVLGLALTAHRRAIIFRREYPQIKAMVDRLAEILGTRRGWNGQERIWRLAGPQTGRRQIEFGACQHPGQERRFQGRAHDLKAFDEITHFAEGQYRYLTGWLRSADPAQRCRVVCTGNPPTDAEGEWVLTRWAPWLDPQHPDPARPGELRWFIEVEGGEREVEGPEPVTHRGRRLAPRSRSFVPARVEDNPHLAEGGYIATLEGLPEPLRSLMREGRFGATFEDDPWQILPSAWVAAAQARWTRDGAGASLTALGVDVARGGRDRTVLSPRHGTWFAPQQVRPGRDTPDGASVAALVERALGRQGGAPACVDVVGVGGSVVDHLRAAALPLRAITGAARAAGFDRTGKLGFANQRALLWWRFREALDPDYGQGLALPPDRALMVDLVAPRWKLTARGIQVEAKEEIVKRIGRSPDLADAAIYAMADVHLGDPRLRQV